LLRTRREREREQPNSTQSSNDCDEIAASHCSPKARDTPIPADYIRDLPPAEWGLIVILRGGSNVGFGSKADIQGSPANVRFTPESGQP